MSSIVVGVDGSEHAQRALRWAVEEARLRGATLRIVHAWLRAPQPWPGYLVAPPPYARDELKQHAETVTREAVEALGDAAAGVEVEAVSVEGPAPECLLEAAERADLLVVGSRGHGGFAGLLLGSVGQQCAHHSACPVVIVPHEEPVRE